MPIYVFEEQPPKVVMLGRNIAEGFKSVEAARDRSPAGKSEAPQAELELARSEVAVFREQTSVNIVLEPSHEDKSMLDRLLALQSQRESIECQIELIHARLKQRIGRASGIRGIATWKTQVRRNYSEDLFRSSDREGYEQVLERFHCIDAARWRREDPDMYKQVQTTYFRASSSRLFKLQARA